MSSIHRSLEKARRPARIEPVNNSEPEKAKSVLGFEPGSLGQNATTQPLAPPPRPWSTLVNFSHFFKAAYKKTSSILIFHVSF